MALLHFPTTVEYSCEVEPRDTVKVTVERTGVHIKIDSLTNEVYLSKAHATTLAKQLSSILGDE